LSQDISPLLDEWPFEPGRINVRLIQGTDGEPRIQVRLDLGLIQMHLEGRPDGRRPNGFPSLLEYFENRLDESLMMGPDPHEGDDLAASLQAGDPHDPQSTPDHADPDDEGSDDTASSPEFSLSPEDCQALREEAAQYYHRYVALLVLEDFEGVIRDTSRNLRVADLCREFAENPSDRTVLEQVRPYILMMRARACAGQALKDDEPKAAVVALEEGIESIRAHYDQVGEPEQFARSREVQLLRSMRESLVPKLPVSQKAELRDRLKEAIARENYELAAILRNELRMLGD
jgi:hypothetical protein